MGNVTIDRYERVIFKPHILKYYEEACMDGRDWILEEDNDGGHGTRSQINPIQQLRQGMDYYANTPVSPDFSIIENVWRILKQRTKNRRCYTIPTLKQALLEEWEGITQESINMLVDSMPTRIEECFRAHGKQTRFQLATL